MNDGLLTEQQKQFFSQEGYLVVENFVEQSAIAYYDDLYNRFLNNSIDASQYRSDLSGSTDQSVEKITQIMLPSRLAPALLQQPFHQRSLRFAQLLMGDDMLLDFDMLINKAPFTNAATPWHQDEAYWIAMPDKRAVSCWMAIDASSKDNGAMWYTPKSHMLDLRPHRQTGNKGALTCDGSEEDSVCIPLRPGSCVFHQGATLHYSRGNNTPDNRRALISNFRPQEMIALERKLGVDHSGERTIRNR
jgi:ectoine hydroxylase-related dioxygenase (phytanoyl-CoA dioxygenase family)